MTTQDSTGTFSGWGIFQENWPGLFKELISFVKNVMRNLLY